MRDPYDVLGVTRTATEADVKKAYRRQAKAWHPDQRPDDPKAKERFSEIGAAYELLSDAGKRAAFDRGEIDAEGKPRFRGFEGAGARGPAGGGRRSTHFEFDMGGGSPFGQGGPFGGRGAGPQDPFEDILGAFGGGRRPRHGGGFGGEPPRGEDVAIELIVPFREWARGAKKRVRLPTGKELEVAVPAGSEDGKPIRLKGQGRPSGLGGAPGDALVTIRVAADPQFRAEGRDVRVEAPITLYEAVLGAKVRVPTLDGAVELKVAPGSDGARTLRLRGKGIGAEGAAGDLLVTLRIALPKGSSALEAFAARLRDDEPYDPRS